VALDITVLFVRGFLELINVFCLTLIWLLTFINGMRPICRKSFQALSLSLGFNFDQLALGIDVSYFHSNERIL